MRAQASYTITAVKDGNDLDGILMLWKKTTTNAAPAKPSGTNLNGWSTDMPEFESGAYVWTCNRVAISDPTASAPMYIYTDPVLDTHWQKLDEVYKQGTDIKNTVDNITLKYYNTNGEETSFKLTNGAIDITLLKNQVDAAATTATNFISMREDGGIEVGNKSGGSWTGYRSQMLADSFNILDASGNYLAKFGANTIDLGLNKENSEIRFCDGLLSLKYDADYSAASLTSDGKIRIFGGNEGIVDIGIIHEESAGLKYSTGLTSTYLGCGISASEGDDFSVDVWSDIWLKHDGTGYWNASSSIEITAPSLKIRGQATGSSWYRGRDYALLASTNAATASAYFPVVDCKAQTGDWSIGTLGDYLYFVYTRDTNYSAGTNTTSKITFNPDGHLILPKSASYQVTFGDGSEAVAVIPYYESSGYKALRFGLPNGGYDTLMCGKDIQLRGDGVLWFYPYYGKANNPNYWGICVGVTSTDIGPCLRPMSNDYCSIGANGIGFRYIYATHTGIQNTSDRRLKENISDDFSKLEKAFGMLHPVTYDYKHLENDDNMRIGFIAQEVWETLEVCGIDPYRFAAIHMEKVDPETDIAKFLDTDETYYLNYTEFTALNTYMIQKLMKRIEKLEKRIA